MLPRLLFAKPYITAPVVAVDFDGTITTDRDAAGNLLEWPAIGEPNLETIERLRDLAGQGWQIVVHTCRTSPILNGPAESLGHMADVRRWLDEHGVPFHDVWPFPKPFADMYVDDKAVSVGDFQKLPTAASLKAGDPRIFFVGDFYMRADLLPGGKGDDRPDSDFDAAALAEGLRHELEHTKDPAVAKEIAKDHLTEDPQYYKKVAKIEAKVEWACLMLDYPSQFAKRVREWTAKNVPDEVLGEDGRENHVHTTVAYGIALDQDPEVIKKVVRESIPTPKAKLGKISKFSSNPEYDALIVEVESKDLHELHAALEAMGLPGNTYPEYKPHMTLAYVKPGSCDHLLGQEPFADEEFTLSDYDLSYASHDKGDHIYFKAGLSRPWALAASLRCARKGITASANTASAPMSEMDMIKELMDMLSGEGYEIVTRYGSGPDAFPDVSTMCPGDCEGTGYVPINFREPAPGEAYFVYSDEDEALYRDAWETAEALEPSEDGYHFLTCPTCGGTGKAPSAGVVAANLRLKADNFGDTQKAARAIVEADPKWTGYLTVPAVAEELGQVQNAIDRARTVDEIRKAWDTFKPSTPWSEVEKQAEERKAKAKEKEEVKAGLRQIVFSV